LTLEAGKQLTKEIFGGE